MKTCSYKGALRAYFLLYQSLREKASEKRDFRENSRNFSTGFPMVRCVKGASIFPKRKKGEEKTGECWFLRRFSLFSRRLFTVSTEFSTRAESGCFCLKDTKFWDFWMCSCALKRTMLYWREENVYNYTRFGRRGLWSRRISFRSTFFNPAAVLSFPDEKTKNPVLPSWQIPRRIL